MTTRHSSLYVCNLTYMYMSFCCCCFQTVPHGVLCFFPSYNMLDKLSKRWQVGWNFSFLIATRFLFRRSQNLVANLGVWHRYCRERQDIHQLLRETLTQQEKTQMFCNKRDRKHERLLLQRFLVFSLVPEKCPMNATENWATCCRCNFSKVSFV